MKIEQVNHFKPRILIVEDEAISVSILFEILSPIYEINVASNAKDALLLVQEKPDLILLDINLPDKSGIEVCKEINQQLNLSNIPIIFITSTNDSKTEEKCLKAGGRDFVGKPFSSAVLKTRVRIHLDLKHKTDLLEKQAFSDSLTNIPNRRSFNKKIEDEWVRHSRSGSSISLLLIDIDFFKFVNDNFGHQVGDECLKNVTKVLQENISRSTDFLARYGGEEFAILLPDTDIKGAYLISEKVRLAVSQSHAVHRDEYQLPEVTISIGVVSHIPTKESSIDSFIEQADKALYKAKLKGRNCVVISD